MGKDRSIALCRASSVCTEMDQLSCLLLEPLYLPRQEAITPGKSQERGLRQRTPCSHCVRAEHPVSTYLPSCPVQAQHRPLASAPGGTQPCVRYLPCRQKHHVPLQTQAKQGGGEVPMEVWGFSPLSCPAYSLAVHIEMGWIQGGNQMS